MEADEEEEQKYNNGLIGHRKKGRNNNNLGLSQFIEDENNEMGHNKNLGD